MRRLMYERILNMSLHLRKLRARGTNYSDLMYDSRNVDYHRQIERNRSISFFFLFRIVFSNRRALGLVRKNSSPQQ